MFCKMDILSICFSPCNVQETGVKKLFKNNRKKTENSWPYFTLKLYVNICKHSSRQIDCYGGDFCRLPVFK